MMPKIQRYIALSFVLLLSACLDFTNKKNSGDCNDNKDCPGDSACIEVTPEGFRVCRLVFQEAIDCQDIISGTDECCTTDQCQEGSRCFDSQAAEPICAGVPPVPHNVCAQDECDNDNDCQAGEICPAAGVFDSAVRRCTAVSCKTDEDCTEEKDGSCATINEGCCGITVTLACIYPSDKCRADTDCIAGEICEIEGGRARCVVGERVCPA